MVKAVFAAAPPTPVVGITGQTGTGKSTLADALTAVYRARGATIGVLAVDPSSPFTGGAVLGDRVRMCRHGEDAGVYVRSMATRGMMGGLAAAAYDTLTLLAAAGFERLLVETVGVGQDEIDVAGVAETTCLVLTPGAGDDVQALKAGIVEVADIFVLNKADLEGAEKLESQLRAWVTAVTDAERAPAIVTTVATEEEGIERLADAIAEHEAWCASTGAGVEKRRALARVRLRSLLRDRLLEVARARGFDRELEIELVEEIAAGRLDPHSAAERVIAAIADPGAKP